MSLGVDLTGRRVLVTGASSGIGAATCRSIVACGGSVAMLARRKERLQELRRVLGERAVPVACDVTDLGALQGAVDEAARTLGGLDGVVTVAGRSMVGTIATGTPERWQEIVNLNLLGPLATIRYVVDHFAEDGRRDVVVVGSAGALTPMAGVGIYAATKRGLRAAFDALRLELAPAGVNVSCVMPGMFDTEGLTMEGVTFDGDIPPPEAPIFAGDAGPGSADDLADAIVFMMSRPVGFCINEMVVRPTRNLNP
ncbi:MAG TPA: SDR family NAD(P)-dependent oxidoreductase [Acidimicrobiales bacterium]|nr:SDR family NAD(P)-dependent oxidoreductase [Acidimicrobiales bacterium]